MTTEFASRADLLAPRGVRYGTMTLPVSGKMVRYRSLSDREYSQFQMGATREDPDGNLLDDPVRIATTRARLIVLCLVDQNGTAIFSEADISALAESLDSADSASLFDRLKDHCGLNRKKPLAERLEAEKKS